MRIADASRLRDRSEIHDYLYDRLPPKVRTSAFFTFRPNIVTFYDLSLSLSGKDLDHEAPLFWVNADKKGLEDAVSYLLLLYG